MNLEQRSLIDNNCDQLCNDIHHMELLQIFQIKQILSAESIQMINTEPTEKATNLLMFKILKTTDNSWDALLKALIAVKQSYLAEILDKNATQTYLAEMLENEVANKKLRVERHNSKVVLNPLYQPLQKQLRQNIIEDCEIIRQVWHDYLPVTKLALVFQKLQVMETNAGRTLSNNIDSDDYKYLADPSCRIFLIEGDPGIGKSTYVNKIAMDWANQHKLLNETFDFVIKLSCNNLENNWRESIVQDFGAETNITANYMCQLLESNRTLIILDGYDENPDKQQLQQVTAKVDSTTGRRMAARLLITTRGTHVNHFINFDLTWLRILGFDEKSAANFIEFN